MKQVLVFIIISLSIITLLAGCTTPSTTNPSPQNTATPVSASSQPSTKPALNAVEVMAPIIAAMRQVSSVNINTNIIEKYSIQGTSQDVHTTCIWDGQRAVDIINDRMHVNMNIETFFDNTCISTKTNVYYEHDTTYGQYWRSGALDPQGGWYKSKLIAEEEYCTAKDQLTPVIGLLESADYVTYKTNGRLDGPDYQVIQFTPTAEAAADWVLSQRFTGGPSFMSTGISITGKTGFQNTFKGGVFQIWVDSETNLITKVYFAPVFQATRDELDELYGYPKSGSDTTYERDFAAQLNFSIYNEPVEPIPAEALNAAGD